MTGIFKAYDIRGRYGTELTEELAYRIGRAFVVFTKTNDVMVGRDARTHSPLLSRALIRGLTDQGACVTDTNIVTTPQTIGMHIWAGHHTAIMITASHLDAPYNGFKMYGPNGKNISANWGMTELEKLTRENNFPEVKKPGTVMQADYTHTYAEHIRKLCSPQTSFKFVADCSNGSTGKEIIDHERALGLQLHVINAEPNGTFPNHSPNPIAPGASEQASQAIKQLNARGGCIFDADADRIVFIDERGTLIHPNAIACLIIEYLLKKNPARSVAYDLISSKAVAETIKRLGGKPVRTRVGRNVLVDDMRREHAIFAAETSSHMIYAEANYADATSLSMLIVLDVLSKTEKLFSEIVGKYLPYALLPETNYEITKQDEAMEEIAQAYSDGTLDRLDGVCVTFNDGWIVARKSNTEPLLRLRAEANTQERLHSIVAKAEEIIVRLGGVKIHISH